MTTAPGRPEEGVDPTAGTTTVADAAVAASITTTTGISEEGVGKVEAVMAVDEAE